MLTFSDTSHVHMDSDQSRTDSVELRQDYWLQETVSFLALSSIPGIGYWTLRNLAQAGYSFRDVLKNSSSFEEFISYFGKTSSKQPKMVAESWTEMQKVVWSQGNHLYHRLKKQGIEVLHYKQRNFPKSLQSIPEPPYWLFVQGNLSALDQPSVAIVGTRQPSEDGVFLATYVGACIPAIGVVTVSGLANGIDQIIHRNSIRYKIPTIAVLGTGIFKNYPAGSEDLRDEICANGGAVITEYLPEQSYSAENFVRRNRIQAGLAKLLIPVEWKAQSGTAHTVRYANASGRSLACLKMSDWQEHGHSELLLAKELGARVFTIPTQTNDFISFVHSHFLSISTHRDMSSEQAGDPLSEALQQSEGKGIVEMPDSNSNIDQTLSESPAQLSLFFSLKLNDDYE